jgi:dihydroorotate dehydrogenase
MTLAELLARCDHAVRPAMAFLPPHLAVRVYSAARNYFLDQFFSDIPTPYTPLQKHHVVLWGLHFRSPIFNSAGIFKNAEGYDMVYRQGAGAYLAGTTTTYPRLGNTKNGIAKPFAPYPRSYAGSNWLGLPNDGHHAVAERLAGLPRYDHFPIGVSIMAAPESSGRSAVDELVSAFHLYDAAGVDFIELNESCPNTTHSDEHKSWSAMVERLQFLSEHFLHHRTRRLPVIVKFSTDTDRQQIAPLIDCLIAQQYDGINIGNTSTQYHTHRHHIHPSEESLYRYFTETFGGGVSGLPLAESAQTLCRAAVEHYRTHHREAREFHVIQTGGIRTLHDIRTAQAHGVALCQWYTGYFEQFARVGHQVYQALLKSGSNE